MKKLTGLAVRFSGVLPLLAAPLLTFAQVPTIPQAPFTTIGELISPTGIICDIFAYLFAFLILIAVIFILLAAYKYVTAQGDPEKVKGANKQILFAAVAVVIAFIARVIPNIALTLVGGSGVTSCT